MIQTSFYHYYVMPSKKSKIQSVRKFKRFQIINGSIMLKISGNERLVLTNHPDVIQIRINIQELTYLPLPTLLKILKYYSHALFFGISEK